MKQKIFFIIIILSNFSCGKKRYKPVLQNESNGKNKINSNRSDEMKPQLNLPVTVVTIKLNSGKKLFIQAQVAQIESEKSKGLMYRKSLPQNEGMLFVYKNENDLGFYMANCFISLDMIFLNSQKKVIGIIKNAVPFDQTVRSIGKPSQYVLEVNGGFSDSHNIMNGTQITWKEWNKK
jgi:uncharacterized membrane protein (UPF0127 family)